MSTLSDNLRYVWLCAITGGILGACVGMSFRLKEIDKKIDKLVPTTSKTSPEK